MSANDEDRASNFVSLMAWLPKRGGQHPKHHVLTSVVESMKSTEYKTVFFEPVIITGERKNKTNSKKLGSLTQNERNERGTRR